MFNFNILYCWYIDKNANIANNPYLDITANIATIATLFSTVACNSSKNCYYFWRFWLLLMLLNDTIANFAIIDTIIKLFKTK